MNDVAVVTNSRHAEQSCACRFVVAKPRFSAVQPKDDGADSVSIISLNWAVVHGSSINSRWPDDGPNGNWGMEHPNKYALHMFSLTQLNK